MPICVRRPAAASVVRSRHSVSSGILGSKPERGRVIVPSEESGSRFSAGGTLGSSVGWFDVPGSWSHRSQGSAATPVSRNNSSSESGGTVEVLAATAVAVGTEYRSDCHNGSPLGPGNVAA